jgi:hypothetical protein
MSLIGYRGNSTDNMYDLPSTIGIRNFDKKLPGGCKSSLKTSFGFGERPPLLNKQGLDSP